MTARVIADTRDTMIGLRLAGIEGIVARSEEQIKSAYEEYSCDENIALIIITEQIYSQCESYFNEKKALKKPLLTVIPGCKSEGPANAIAKALEEAIGVCI